MTAHSMKGDRERCIAVGMDDYLSKPLRADALDTVLGRWVDAGAVDDAPEEQLDLGVLERLREDLGGARSDALDAIIAEYLRALPGRVDAIAAALEAGDPQRLRDEAHALKGASLTFGASRVGSLCERLERAGREDRLEGLDGLGGELRQAARATRTVLEQQLADPEVARPAV
jgi:HPt (histidine-containing phosphotransfer) domain-containing protein